MICKSNNNSDHDGRSDFFFNAFSEKERHLNAVENFNKGIRFLVCVIDTLSKYAWAIPFKDKRGITIVNAFQKVLNKSDHKPNKI